MSKLRKACGHGRPLTTRVDCPACALRIRPDHYWQLVSVVRRRLGIASVPRRGKGAQ